MPVLLLRAVALVASNAYDVRIFEDSLFPKWIAQYRLGGGNYSFTPGGRVPHPYAPSDVVHAMCFVGILDELPPSERHEIVTGLQAWQYDDGFFANADAEGAPGGTRWHAIGYITAGLSLLRAQPLKRNQLFDGIAATPSLWQPTIQGLLDVDARPPSPNISAGCSSGYQCAQNIASLASWYIQTNSTFAGLSSYASFMRWYFKYLRMAADPITGLWCTPAQQKKHGKINCIGGSFHIDFIFQAVAEHRNEAPGADPSFPFPAAQFNTSLSLELPGGGWTRSGLEYLNVDGLYQLTRASLQLGRARWPEVEQACDRLMAKVTKALTDSRMILGNKGKVSQNSHTLPALVSAVAECQKMFPSMIKTRRPWKMCLDSVPYI